MEHDRVCASAVGQRHISIVDLSTAGRLAETFKILGDPTRVRIISALRAGELCVNDLAEALEMSQSAVSHQLSVLRHLHLVRARKEGRQVYYVLDDEHVLSLFAQGLDHVLHT
jgi:ArsR family transcriptional regulator, lead/cadmium/zinc/bismuth-responsive transcriptional repressor